MTSPEKRKFARLDMALTVSYAVRDARGNPSPMAEAVSTDVSAGGLRLMTPTPLPNGSRIDLDLILGERVDPLHAAGEVVWQHKLSPTSYETGVVIQHMEDEDKKRFMQFIFDQMARLIGLPTTQ
ncbi:MAG: PilZ domain-containing protein [Deltaproteobacteria bacterium]|nr:PilZ domain-containing protein [Deltaproteobacteria bacterium]